MGLRPTHRDESPFLPPIDSKWVMRDFRRSVMGISTVEDDIRHQPPCRYVRLIAERLKLDQ